VLIKGTPINKDLRFDVPTIGLQTIEHLKNANASCLAIGAQQVILMDKQQVIDTANKANITIISLDPNGKL